MNTPLFLLSNDDGYAAKGLDALIQVARQLGDVVVMSTEVNASAKGLSLTTQMPLRARQVRHEDATPVLHSLDLYACNGTPADCVKLALDFFCPRRPDLVLSGINHGSNASINILYSGTMGAALEAATNHYSAIGFSLLDHHADADFSSCQPYMKQIIEQALLKGLPSDVALNVNFPILPASEIKGIRVCRASHACWTNSFEKRVDPQNHPYWWLTGKFVYDDCTEDTDQWALNHGYISIVPVRPDYTAADAIDQIKSFEQ